MPAPQLISGGRKLLDLDQVSVAWTAIAHLGGMGFGRVALTKGESAALVRCPAAVIVADDGLGFAVAESDVVDRYDGPPSKVAAARPAGQPGGGFTSRPFLVLRNVDERVPNLTLNPARLVGRKAPLTRWA